MKGYPVPLQLQNEEKIIGGYLSGRQLLYLLSALLPTYLLINYVIGLFHWYWGGRLMMAVWGVMLFISGLLWLIALALAFLPAGFLGLPGPRYSMSSNPYDPPLRLDQWLQLRYKHRTKHKILPYRRCP